MHALTYMKEGSFQAGSQQVLFQIVVYTTACFGYDVSRLS